MFEIYFSIVVKQSIKQFEKANKIIGLTALNFTFSDTQVILTHMTDQNLMLDL